MKTIEKEITALNIKINKLQNELLEKQQKLTKSQNTPIRERAIAYLKGKVADLDIANYCDEQIIKLAFDVEDSPPTEYFKFYLLLEDYVENGYVDEGDVYFEITLHDMHSLIEFIKLCKIKVNSISQIIEVKQLEIEALQNIQKISKENG